MPALAFTLILPFILSYAEGASVSHMVPAEGKPGHPVNIKGDGFKSCSSVTVLFGGIPVSIKNNNDEVIKFNVPDVNNGWYAVTVTCDTEIIPAGTFHVQ